ncbi:DUF2922 family protein [Eubacterium maltosivorans]|uniref:DUF2922 family protein n=1 Tax=Eubacterium maltosivorans TaxID=2041044 RepID=UPI003A92EE46
METVSTKTLDLEFMMENGDTDTISLPDYLPDVTKEQIVAAADIVIAQNIFKPDGFAYQKLKGYEFIDKTRLGYRPVGEFRQCGYKFGRWYNMLWMEKHIGAHQSNQPRVKAFEEVWEELEAQYE